MKKNRANIDDLIFGTTVGVAFAGLIYFIFQSEVHLSQLRQEADAERAACISLNPKYGQFYTALTGPYEGVKMKAVKFESKGIYLQLPDSNETVGINCTKVKAL